MARSPLATLNSRAVRSTSREPGFAALRSTSELPIFLAPKSASSVSSSPRAWSALAKPGSRAAGWTFGCLRAVGGRGPRVGSRELGGVEVDAYRISPALLPTATLLIGAPRRLGARGHRAVRKLAHPPITCGTPARCWGGVTGAVSNVSFRDGLGPSLFMGGLSGDINGAGSQLIGNGGNIRKVNWGWVAADTAIGAGDNAVGTGIQGDNQNPTLGNSISAFMGVWPSALCGGLDAVKNGTADDVGGERRGYNGTPWLAQEL